MTAEAACLVAWLAKDAAREAVAAAAAGQPEQAQSCAAEAFALAGRLASAGYPAHAAAAREAAVDAAAASRWWLPEVGAG